MHPVFTFISFLLIAPTLFAAPNERVTMKSTVVVDMHYAALLGTGWSTTDPGHIDGSPYEAYVTADVIAGAYSIPVSTVTGLNVGVLATYQSADGDWYSFRVVSSSNLVIGTDRPLRAISAGATVSNVYRDDAHVNVNGGALVADEAIRQIASGRLQELEIKLRENWIAFGPATISYTPTFSYHYPGSHEVGERAALVAGASTGGVVSSIINVFGGDYQGTIPINTGLHNALPNAVSVIVEEIQSDGTWQQVAVKTYEGMSATYLATIEFSVTGERLVRFKLQSNGASNWNFAAGEIALLRNFGSAHNLNAGKVVVFGDSWATIGSPIASRLVARLSNAVVVAKGLGGDRSDQMIARFQADVVPENPDTVIVISGTNGVYQGLSPASEEANIAVLRDQIRAIGATPIFLTASVCSGNYVPASGFPQPFLRSRNYLAYIDYHDLAVSGPALVAPWRAVPVDAALTIPANTTVPVATLPGKTQSGAFVQYLTSDNDNISLSLDDRVFDGAREHRKWWTRKHERGPVVLTARNSTGVPQFIKISAEILWKGDGS